MSISTLQTVKNNFVTELTRAANNETSSLSYIRHTLPSQSLVQDGEIFQVCVIGGTFFRSALCKKNKGRVEVISSESDRPPKFSTKEDFLAFLLPWIDTSVEVVCLNFAYPLSPVYDGTYLDGVLIAGSKENTFDGLVGKQVGSSIARYVKEQKGKEIQFTVANDTVCLLLSGLNQYTRDELFGGIVGTGVNFALFDNEHAVNLEAANFDKFPLSKEATHIDAGSQHPGSALFEKEVSGAYLYHHYNLQSHISGTEKELQSTLELAQYALKNDNNGLIAKNILEHSAALVACQIAGILEYKKRNGVGIMEGSLFWKADHYRELVETYVGMLTSYSVAFTKMDQDSILGGALLVG